MTDKEHAALEWLDGATHPLMSDIEDIRHTNTIKAMLARLPSPTDHAAIDALAQRAPTIPRQWIAEIIRIINEPPKPVTKVVQVWAVWWAKEPSSPMGYVTEALAYPTKEAAEEEARKAREEGLLCVRVTGPHDQEVPIERRA